MICSNQSSPSQELIKENAYFLRRILLPAQNLHWNETNMLLYIKSSFLSGTASQAATEWILQVCEIWIFNGSECEVSKVIRAEEDYSSSWQSGLYSRQSPQGARARWLEVLGWAGPKSRSGSFSPPLIRQLVRNAVWQCVTWCDVVWHQQTMSQPVNISLPTSSSLPALFWRQYIWHHYHDNTGLPSRECQLLSRNSRETRS